MKNTLSVDFSGKIEDATSSLLIIPQMGQELATSGLTLPLLLHCLMQG